MKKSKLYLIISILSILLLFCIQVINSAYNYQVQKQNEIAELKKTIAVKDNVINDIDNLYPGIGEALNEITEGILNDQYKMDASKILDPFIEEKTKIAIELHGLEQYSLRFKDFIFPVENLSKSFARCPENEFGWRKLKWNKDISFHTGFDIYTIDDTKVISCGDGKVIYIGEDKKYGKIIIIRHYLEKGYIDSYYGHLSEIKVKRDQIVKQGEFIAIMGQTGTECTARHLHWGLRYYVNCGKYTDKNGIEKTLWKIMHLNPVMESTYNKDVEEKRLI